MVGTSSRKALWLASLMLTFSLAGCLGGDEGFDFKPGEGFKETGREVKLRMWVEDLIEMEVYPGFKANLWAFCAEAKDPNDQYSVDAIEYRHQEGTLMTTAGAARDALGDKCSVPGPQLRVKQGDRVIVEFQNEHFHPHTIHWHGQYVPWESDGVPGNTQDSVTPGTSFTYDFIARRAGTLWYHCHVDTQFHVMQGLFGVIIVEPQDETYEPKDIDREYTFVYHTLVRDQVEAIPLKPGEVLDPHAKHRHGATCGASGIQGCQNPPVDVSPDTWMLNGVSLPNTLEDPDSLIKIDVGERVRVRFLNAGETVETIHTHGHDMLVTHRDGNPLPPAARFYVDTLLIGPAERYDVVIEGHTPGAWMMHTHVDGHVTNDHMAPGGGMSMIVYPGFEDKLMSKKGELAGGLPYQEPLNIPADLFDSALFRFLGPDSPSPTLEDSWTFPVSFPCASRSATFTAALDPNHLLAGQAQPVTVTLTAPDGTLVKEFALDSGNRTASWSEVAENLQMGDYTASVSGTLVDGNLELSVHVDYYETEDQLSALGRSCVNPA
ncbi:MAG: multicopper oxidase domain-containing protein [Thermoplasmatota archaeon]